MRHLSALRLLLALALVAPAASCRSGRRDARPAPAGRRADLITLDELQKRAWTDLYEAIVVLRLNWLNRRGEDTLNSAPGEVQVFLDGAHYGGWGTLHGMPVVGVTSIQFIDGITAAGRWGLGYSRGVIWVTSSRKVEP
ncbi:MAG TPA: hypothetical protein VKA84_09635 [Gemmatimonadaceae bacterium]|nr:hypothetical protein [Gemmatimonadaceae bacterium]